MNIATLTFIAFLLIAATLFTPVLRRNILTRTFLFAIRALKMLPQISATEKEALDAGTTWVDSDLFRGQPDFEKLMIENYPKLNAEEQAFIDGPCNDVCNMVRDWDIQKRGDLPPEVWEFLKRNKFFGLIVPKKYGGLEFSSLANSAMIVKLASRSYTLAITAMVPNSLGPAELLHLYGTSDQKDYYLPRLAIGDDIPCFGLTESEAGSDAGSIQSEGILFKDNEGKISVRLNWRKRYITLGSAATLIGLAIKLRDPENLLGKRTELGITAILVPANLPGVRIDMRHDPLGVCFINSCIEGTNVIVSAEKQIIGGLEGAGKGWKMLMGCLAAGRGISLPATAAGSAKYGARVVSAYASVRKQFALNIGTFEGIQEHLARIGGTTYMLEAVRTFTCGGIDSGKKSSVISAIAKAYATELGRRITIDQMDVMGGSAISLGPKNLIAQNYISAPIGVTVEGANTLTRSMIIFGNGVFRCHPYIYKEMSAALDGNLKEFDSAFWSHVWFAISTLVRVPLFSLTHGWITTRGWGGGKLGRYRRKLARTSAAFALHTEIFLATYTGSLKVRELLTGRMSDVLAYMYFALAVMRRYEDQGQPKEFWPFTKWSLDFCFTQTQAAFEQTARNIETPIIGHVFRWIVLPWTRLMSLGAMPSDATIRSVAKAMLAPGKVRDEITNGIFEPQNSTEPLRELELAMLLAQEAKKSQFKIRAAITSKKIKKGSEEFVLQQAVAQGIITEDEAMVHHESRLAMRKVIEVDIFDARDFLAHNVVTPMI
jgi:acyl-CoA dehydrogenase